MSFRKRSVRPNLNLSKRSVAVISEQKHDNTPNDEKHPPVEEKLSAGPPTTDTTSILSQNIDQSADTKAVNSREESCSSPLPGKRLAKRTKVTPKLTLSKKTKDVSKTDNEVSQLSSQTLPVTSRPNVSPKVCSPPHVKNAIISTVPPVESRSPKQNIPTSHIAETIDETNNCYTSVKDISVEPPAIVDQPMDVLSVYKLLTKGKDSNDSLDHDLPQCEEKNTTVDSNINSKTDVGKEKRLSKRRRVMPNLSSRTSNKNESNAISGQVENDAVTVLEKEKLNAGFSSTPVDNKNNENNTTKTLQNESQDVICNNKVDDTTPSKTSRLQKRVKVRPKLKVRTTAVPCDNDEPVVNDLSKSKDNDVNKTQNIGLDDFGSINNDIDSSCRTTKTKDSYTSNKRERTKDTMELELTADHSFSIPIDNKHSESTYTNRRLDSIDDDNITPSLDSNNQSIFNNLDSSSNCDLNLEKKELKHVRFTSDDAYKDIDYDDNSNDYLTEITSKQFSPNQIEADDDNGLRSSVPADNQSAKYDSNDEYDSLSEGEILGKKLISKNKVFKPNIGGKRRERLSSFSAYSSCDEEDWQNQKKRKEKKTKKNPEEGDKLETKKQEEKKKLKKPGKPKKNRENVEPNVKKEPKPRKKKAKPDGSKPPKVQEERDLSSLTMQELIHYNHPSFKTVELRSKRDEDEDERVIDMGGSVPVVPSEEKPKIDTNGGDDEVMAPQIMINEDGEIVINQASLTISKKVDDTTLKNSAVVYEDSLSYGTHLKRKHAVGKRWKIDETLRFYKALSEIGTDFTLMSQAFGRFTRNELKKKFKKEEKVNCDLVDRALSNRLPLNMEMFLRGKEEMKDTIDAEKNGVVITPDDVITPNDVAANPTSAADNGDACIVECGGE